MFKEYAKYIFPIFAGLILVATSVANFNTNVLADGAGSEAACDNADFGSVDPSDDESTTPFVFNFDTGAGNVVTGVCIKSGSNMFGDSHSGLLGNGTYENGCYTIAGVGTQIVTVTRNNSGRTCQGISHLDIETDTVIASPSPSPDPSPSPSPSPDPSPSPSPSPDPSPSPSPSPEVSPSPSPEVSPSPNPCEGASCNTGGGSPSPSPSPSPETSPSPEPSPSPSSGGSTGGSNSSSSGGGEVLGASTGPETLAATGSTSTIALYGLGIILTAAGLKLRKALK